MADKLALMRRNWDKFAARFTETANKRMTLQCARELHAHMQLEGARRVLEVAAGGGLGSLDIARRMSAGVGGSSARKSLTVTDFSPAMLEIARENLKDAAASGLLDLKCMEGNGVYPYMRIFLSKIAVSLTLLPESAALDLADIATGSMDRYVSSLTLQLVPDADAMLREARRVLSPGGVAGFTIWASPERSGFFTINAAANAELGLEQSNEHSNFALGKDLDALRGRFKAAGFASVRVWPFQCVIENWSAKAFAEFHREAFPLGPDEQELGEKRLKVVERMADEWFETRGFPIGLETYIVLAKL